MKPLYIDGGVKADPERCSLIANREISEATYFRASHEKADDRIMHSINKIYALSSKSCDVTVISPDTDIFVSLLYHLQNTWHGSSLYLLRKGNFKEGKTRQKELYPLYLLLGATEQSLVDSR